MNIKRIIFTLFISSLLSSCDKPRSIRFYNDLSSNVIIQFNHWEDSINDKKFISLNPKQSMILLVHGSNGHIFGNWSKEELEVFSKSVKSFTIIVNAKDTFYISNNDKFALLLKSRKYMLNSSLIKINIDKKLLQNMSLASAR